MAVLPTAGPRPECYPSGRFRTPAAYAAPMAHEHSSAGPPADPRVRRTLAFVLVPLAVLTLVALVVQWPGPARIPDNQLGLPRHLVRGVVRSVAAAPCPGTDDGTSECRL